MKNSKTMDQINKKWSSDTECVDLDTGEKISREEATRNYIFKKLKKITNYEFRHTKYIREYQRTTQLKLEL